MKFAGSNTNVMYLPNILMFLISRFLRFSKLSNTERSDIVFKDVYLSLFMRPAKQMYKERAIVV